VNATRSKTPYNGGNETTFPREFVEPGALGNDAPGLGVANQTVLKGMSGISVDKGGEGRMTKRNEVYRPPKKAVHRASADAK
jgi:hypothetical protein